MAHTHAELREKSTVHVDWEAGKTDFCLPQGFSFANVGTRFSQVRRTFTQKIVQKCTRRKKAVACSLMAKGHTVCPDAPCTLVPMASTRMDVRTMADLNVLPMYQDPVVPAGEDSKVAAEDKKPAMPPKAKGRPLAEILEESMLYVQVKTAARLTPAQLSGVSDPYVQVSAGGVQYRTHAVRQSLNPDWNNETFTFKGSAVTATNMIVAFEVWSMDDFHPDDFLGQAEVDLRKLPLSVEPGAGFSCSLTLYVLKTNGKKETGDFGELNVRVWLTPTGNGQEVLAPAGALRGQIQPELCKKYKVLPSVVHNSLGTLYEEPCVVYIRVAIDQVIGLYEKGTDSHAGLGTPKEINTHSCTLAKRAACKGRLLIMQKIKKLRHTASGTAAEAISSLRTAASHHLKVTAGTLPHAATDGGLAGRFAGFTGLKKNFLGSKAPRMPGTIEEDGEGEEEELALREVPLDEDRAAAAREMVTSDALRSNLLETLMQRSDSQSLADTLSQERKPAYLYMEVEYAQQTYTSRMVRLHVASGTARIKQDFVFATVRPISSRPMMIGIYVTGKKNRAGRLVGQFTEDMTDLVRVCMKAEADAKEAGINHTGATLSRPTMADEYTLPLMSWPLDDGYHGLLRMHVGAADADYRPQMYNVPLLQPLATTSGLSVDSESTPKSTPKTGNATVASSGGGGKAAIARQESSSPLGHYGSELPTDAMLSRPMAGLPKKPRNEVERWLQGAQEGTIARGNAAALAAAAARQADNVLAADKAQKEEADKEADQKAAARKARSVFLVWGDAFTDAAKCRMRATLLRLLVLLTALMHWALDTMRRKCRGLKVGDTVLVTELPENPEEEEGGSPSAPQGQQTGPYAQAWESPERLSNQEGLKQENARREAAAARQLPRVPRAPKPALMRPLGTLHLKLEKLKLSLPGVYHFTVIKCGPHWIRTPLRRSQDPSPFEWQMAMPVYDPADTMTYVTFYQKTPNAKPADIHPYARSFAYMSNLTPNAEIERHLQVPMIPPGRNKNDKKKDKKDDKGRPGNGSSQASEYSAGGTDSNGKNHFIAVNFTIRLEYHSWQDVAAAYVRPFRPDAWYTLGLDGASQEQLQKQYNTIIARWLERSHPALPHSLVKEVLKDRRQSFSINQIKTNLARVKVGLAVLRNMSEGYDHLVTWSNPVHSGQAVALLLLLAFQPSLALAAFFVWILKVIHKRRHLAGLPPNRHRLGGDALEADDEELDAPTDGAIIARLRRQYEQAVAVALLAQNYLDDIATVFERFHALLSWADPAATIITVILLTLVAAAMYFLGLPVLFSAVGLYLLRPPQFRDPLPAPPVALFMRLPAALGSGSDVRMNRVAWGEHKLDKKSV